MELKSLFMLRATLKKAFESVHRETLWTIMKVYGIPEKLIEMVKITYEDNKCSVVDGTGVYEWLDIKSGVKQGCSMSGFLFLLIIDWVMRQTPYDNNTGILWKMTTKLDDLDFADDIALLSSTKETKNIQPEQISNINWAKIKCSKNQIYATKCQ